MTEIRLIVWRYYIALTCKQGRKEGTIAFSGLACYLVSIIIEMEAKTHPNIEFVGEFGHSISETKPIKSQRAYDTLSYTTQATRVTDTVFRQSQIHNRII